MSAKQLVNALLYELAMWLIRRTPRLRNNSILQRLIAYCQVDWVEWKVSRTMKGVDDQIEQLTQKWDTWEAELQKPVFSELPPDGSEAQALLGGELRLRAPWVKE